jgi:hypothetical protein
VALKTNLQPCLEGDNDVQALAQMLIVQNDILCNIKYFKEFVTPNKSFVFLLDMVRHTVTYFPKTAEEMQYRIRAEQLVSNFYH